MQLDPTATTPLVTQIVQGLAAEIDAGSRAAGAKLPSIRQFAQAHGVSVFTVVEAYDRLVAQGLLVARPHSGFFVRARAAPPSEPPPQGFDAQWYLRKIFEHRHLAIKPGCGWLPPEWLYEDGLRRALRALAAEPAPGSGYGDPKGHPPLRARLAEELGCAPAQVLLTQGSSQGLDVAVRRLVRPGDAVLVDDPGYANLLLALRLQGATLLGVPRTPEGWDLDALAGHLAAHRPRVFFTQPRLPSPTGASATLAQRQRLLQLAEAHDLTLVENDIYVDLDPAPLPSLGELDGLARVVRLGSYSKTVSPGVRVGWLAAPADLADDLAQLKMLAGLTSAELGERLVLSVLQSGGWQRHLKALRQRLAQAHGRVAAALTARGFTLFAQPGAGMFLWARHPALPDALPLSNAAARAGIMLGPGHLFTPDLRASPWLRFNVAWCEDERLWLLLDGALGAGLTAAGRAGTP